jgi:hypothetical protein
MSDQEYRSPHYDQLYVKCCPSCQQIRLSSDFYGDCTRRYGLERLCKTCSKAASSKRGRIRRERARKESA